jgi:hypothetical protein
VDTSLLAHEGDGILLPGIVNQLETQSKSDLLNFGPACIARSSSNVAKLSSSPSPSFNVAKVKLSISVKISNCSYLEIRFSLTKNT